ncbi:MAG: response regulator [Candidatus Hodarchaeales archaeon]
MTYIEKGDITKTGDHLHDLESRSTGRRSILIVEDDIDHMEIIQSTLADNHPHLVIEITDNGLDAINKIKNSRYDIIIVDYHIPGLTGLELLDEIRNLINEGLLTNIPKVIFCTGKGSEEIAVLALKKGVVEYVTKNTSFFNRVDEIVSEILTNGKEETFPLKYDDLHVILFTIGNLGPKMIYKDKSTLPEELNNAIDMTGVYFFTAIGQGKTHHLGLFGPLPIPGSNDYRALAFTILINDKNQTDSRMRGMSYCLITIIYPKEKMEFFYDHQKLTLFLNKSFENINDMDELNEKFMDDLKRRLYLIIQDF